jgi:hypothetical protein
MCRPSSPQSLKSCASKKNDRFKKCISVALRCAARRPSAERNRLFSCAPRHLFLSAPGAPSETWPGYYLSSLPGLKIREVRCVAIGGVWMVSEAVAAMVPELSRIADFSEIVTERNNPICCCGSSVASAPAEPVKIAKAPFRGHKWPLFHRCFALKREAKKSHFPGWPACKSIQLRMTLQSGHG